jgi:hypothetical protein
MSQESSTSEPNGERTYILVGTPESEMQRKTQTQTAGKYYTVCEVTIRFGLARNRSKVQLRNLLRVY